MSLKNYFGEVKAEMAHVSFPSRKQTIFFTVLVILISLAVSIYLGVFDFIFKLAVEKILNFR